MWTDGIESNQVEMRHKLPTLFFIKPIATRDGEKVQLKSYDFLTHSVHNMYVRKSLQTIFA